MNNQEQYVAEQHYRFLSSLGKLAEYTQPDPSKARNRRRALQRDESKKAPAAATTQQQTLPPNIESRFYRQIQPNYVIRTLILDSSHRNADMFLSANNFTLRLSDPIRNVAMLRLLKTEFYEPTNTQGYFVINGLQIPLQVNSIEHAYLYLNGYAKAHIGNNQNATVLGRIGPGVEHYPAVSGSIVEDPYAYLFQPMEPRLSRFNIRLLTHEGALYSVQNARVVITMALYCLPT